MTLYTPAWMQPAGGDPAINFSGLHDRLVIQSLWETEGVVSGLGVTQRAAGANFSVDIAAGQAVITGNDVATQGSYLVTSDAVENRTIPSPPGSGTRVHRVVAWVKDKLYDGTQTTYEWTLSVLEDTGSGTPAAPASAITLATVSVSAGQASVLDSHITKGFISALARPNRGRLVAADSGRPPVPLEGEELWRTDGKYKEIYNGTSWKHSPLTPGPDVFARKTADTTRNNNATLADDPHLSVALAANATYLIEGFISWRSVTGTPNLKFAFTFPAGATIRYTPAGLDTSVDAGEGIIRLVVETTSTHRNLATTSSDIAAIPRGTIRTAATAGNLTFQWAQQTATAENTTVHTDSWLRAIRVA